MFKKKSELPNLTLILLIASILCIHTNCHNILDKSAAFDDINGYDMVHATTADIIRSRGYIAEDHFVTTTDGYILNLVRALNPLLKDRKIKNRRPLLCIHGWTFSVKYFVVNSINARPRDYSNLDAGEIDLDNLKQLLLRDPSKNSLVFTALNFGHEVWLLNRRGSTPSLGHINTAKQAYISPLNDLPGLFSQQASATNMSKTNQTDYLLFIKNQQSKFTALDNIVNPRYWNFSLDEQAGYDLPETIDYILNVTQQERVSLVAHSQGGSLVLMLLSTKPEYANKISKSLLWAPALYLQTEGDRQILGANEEATRNYVGPIPQPILIPSMRQMLASACDGVKRNQQPRTCSQAISALYGFAGGQQTVKPGFVASFVESVGSRETGSLLQAIKKGKMHFYDHGSSDKNIAAYGVPEAPIYNVSKITSKSLTFWNGNSDSATTISSVEQIAKDMQVNHSEQYYLNKTGLLFTHISFFIHKKVASLIVLPGIKVLHSE